MNRTILTVVLAASTAILPVAAQQQDDDGYAPEHGVARISLTNGDVSVRRGDSGELTAAAINGPMVVNDHLATGPGSRAEIQFDWGNMIRLGQDTEVRLGDLQDRRYLVQIATGTTTFRVLRDSSADVEISTPTVSVRPVEQGSYRVTVLPDGTTEITVRAGRAEIFSPRGTEMLTAGRTMEARGTPSDPEYMILAAIPQDEWDRWNVDRDRVMDRTSSYRYVSPDIVGAEDLDPYGRWTTDPQYGSVWVPTVDPGWAPYRVGRWVDEPYYGWTWVSGDPWGWAPYHYGNWYMSSFGWAWYPGPFGGRHYWRPALVGFFGWGSGGGFGFGFGNVGWCPLAPYERFHPWYGRGVNTFNNTTIINNVSVVNNYRNAQFVNGRNGVTSINANDFGRGRAVNTNNFVRASSNDLVRAGSVQGRLPFTASADARRMSDRPVNTQALPRVNDNTRFAQRGGGTPASNAASAGAIGQATQGRTPATPQGFQGRPAQTFGQTGPVRGNNTAPAVVGNGNGNAGGWRRFEGVAPGGNDGQQNGNVRGGPVTNGPGSNGIVQTPGGGGNRGNSSNGPGWRRFEGPTPNAPAVIGGGGNNQRTAPGQYAPAPQGRSFPERAAPVQNAPAPQVRSFPDRQAPGQYAPAPQGRSFPAPQQQDQRQFRPSAPPPQQPVRISPQIVRDRGPAPVMSRPEPPRGGGFSAPPRPQGGGGGNGGGGNRGGGNGGGHDNRR